MKHRVVAAWAFTGLACVLTWNVVLADAPVSIVGEGACAKCQFKIGNECQITVTVAGEGQDVTYYLKENEETKKLGKQLCSERKQVKATGTIKTADGKFELTPTKVEIVTDVLPESQ